MIGRSWGSGIWITLIAGTLCACASRKVVLPPNQLEPIRRLSVQPFEGPGSADVTREFTEMLKANGWAIAAKNQSADAVLTGNIVEYKAAQRLMIFLGETNTLSGGKTVTVSNPVVSVNGSQVLPQGPTISMNSPHLVTERAVVGLVVRLVAQPKGNTVWGDEFSYESLNLASSRHAVITALVGSLGRASARLEREVSPGGKS